VTASLAHLTVLNGPKHLIKKYVYILHIDNKITKARMRNECLREDIRFQNLLIGSEKKQFWECKKKKTDSWMDGWNKDTKDTETEISRIGT
jgi:hypothetical protein